MTRLTKFILPLLLLGLLAACDDGNPVDGGDDDIDVPTAYGFESRFGEGSSVAYPGQVARNLLIQDLKIVTDGVGAEGAQPVTLDELLARYEEGTEGVSIITSTTPEAEAQTYGDISAGKYLADRLTGLALANEPLVGRGDTTADVLVRHYLAQIAAQSQTEALGTPAAFTTDAGVDMSQIVNKVLLGAVTYAQGTAKYLHEIEDDANDAAVEGQPFTQMEHHWDEAFGYFGAARPFATFSDTDLAGGSSAYRDVDGDGAIDFNSEYNFTFATYAGKRDEAATGVDFSQDLFDAFLVGRTAIVNQAPLQDVLAARDDIRTTWEQLVAANIVHYINSSIEDVDALTPAQVNGRDSEELNEHWSEAKGFAYALQYNPVKAISDAQLAQLHTLLGEAPPYAKAAAAARTDLLAARDLLQDVYGFSGTNAQAW